MSCGGGGGGTAQQNNSNSTPSNLTAADLVEARLVDAPVSGVDYVCENNVVGRTGAFGQFSYIRNTRCSFKIGNISLGTIATFPSDNIVTPYDLAGVSRVNTLDSNAIAIAQLLQSIDTSSNSDGISISSDVAQNLLNATAIDISKGRSTVTSSVLSQLVSIASNGSKTLVSKSDAASIMNTYLAQVNIDTSIRVPNPNAPTPTSDSKLHYVYKYGWQKTDEIGLKIWCNMDGAPANCTPTYYIDGCRSYSGSCTKTNLLENIAETGNGLVYRAYPIKPNSTFIAKYLGFGLGGGGHPDFVAIYDSTLGSWNPQYTPSSGQIPNTQLAKSTTFDIFFNGTFSDTNGNNFSRHPGSNPKTPGFQAYLGSTGVSIAANNIYWIVVKYIETGVRNERCIDFIGPNQFTMPDKYDQDVLMHYGTGIGNGFAYELMSSDGINWEPSNMIQGGTCNTFLAN